MLEAAAILPGGLCRRTLFPLSPASRFTREKLDGFLDGPSELSATDKYILAVKLLKMKKCWSASGNQPVLPVTVYPVKKHGLQA